MENKHVVIAVDGVSGSGKSVISKAIAKTLGYNYLDTGAIYRAITVIALENGIDADKVNEKDPSTYKKLLDILKETKLEFNYDAETNKSIVKTNGKDITNKLKTPETSNNVAKLSKIEDLRKWARTFQYEYAKNGNIIIEGRDITTVIFPETKYKLYITSTPEERAKRRVLDYEKLGKHEDYDKVLQELKKRDELDLTREHSPLKIAKDAFVLDTSNQTPEQSISLALEYIKSIK